MCIHQPENCHIWMHFIQKQKAFFYTVSKQQVLGNGYRWAASATSPGAFEVNLLTAGIPEGVPIQMLQTCLI